MCDAYRASSSVRVEQMEAELSQQISALRAEIEEDGAGTSRSYSSVLPPRDISSFRMEKEHALRRGLQVAGALPVQSPADVMQRELESCFGLEYTPDTLPPLLHNFFTDRSYHLAQIKYLLMLRWRRFCRHTSVIEKLYPHYKDQVAHLTSEYEDAVQRARRLSVGREAMLTGRGTPAPLLTRDDVLVYLRWLVCHLHSVQTIHNFLRVLHYIPACERKECQTSNSSEEEGTFRQTEGVSEQTEKIPLLCVRPEEFLPELQSLITYFHLSYDTRTLWTAADGMELFVMVRREFGAIFRRQEQMKRFPPYGGTEVGDGQWGRRSASTALRKEADWIPYVQVKPRRDPWRQKLITKLKEKNSVDELLKTHCRFLQVPDPLQVAAALKEHAARVGASRLTPTFTSSSPGRSEARRQKISEIWTSVYGAAGLAQETQSGSSRSRGGGGGHGQSSRRSTRSATGSLQLLELEDSLEDGASDPLVTRGAYLSLIYLRHLKLRELQRVSLGMLNYLRSVERTLTFDLAGLQLEEGELRSAAEETGWMNAARGGGGEAGGLGSRQFNHDTPVDYKVHCSEFMEFAEVENLQDFYSAEERVVHTQDPRGFYIVYDAALKDLDQLEDELLLVGSHFLWRSGAEKVGKAEEVDRVAVLLDLWTCETEFLESKVQLLNCYCEAYQHTAGTEERSALARVITDIMHHRPLLDLNQGYFAQAYRAEVDCLRSHQQLIKHILDNQIENQRQYLRRIWRADRKASTRDFGLPLNYVPKHTVSLGGSSPAQMNVFLLEVHPSLCLASAVYQGLVQAHSELCQLHRATGASDRLALQQRLLRQALQSWSNLASPGASYSPQIQKDLFSGVFFEDPLLVQEVGLSLVKSAEEEDVKQGRETRSYAVETFSELLELVTIRHRLLESASETAHLAQLYRDVASELGFSGFHLHLRPVPFEVAEQKDQTERRPIFITSALEGDASVDRFSPSHLPLGIQELDDDQIGRFSFSSEEEVVRLMNKQSIENLQVTLGCQVTQKNALISASEEALHSHNDVKSATGFDSKLGRRTDNLREKSNSLSSSGVTRTPTTSTTKQRMTEAFVSVQREKVGLRDEMLNSFMKKKQDAGGLTETPEEAAAKIKRSLIIEYLKKFNTRISQYCVRAQIVAYYSSLRSLLDDIPSVRQSHFWTEPGSEPQVVLDSGADLCPDPSRPPPRRLLSADGKTLLNLWVIPPVSGVLRMFKTLETSACATALHHALHIASALRDVVYYLVSFSRLGNTEISVRRSPGARLVADWGGAEGIGAELLEIQRQVDRLPDPSSPESVGRLLQLRRQVLLLQFDTAVRHLIREAFLSAGDVASYQSVSDNMAVALPLLSDSLQTDVFGLTLPVPPPLEARGCPAQRMFPWRSFLACHGLFPLHVWNIPDIEYCMQLCLSGLRDCSRLQANAAILGVSLLVEDVLSSGSGAAGPMRLLGNTDDLLHNGKHNQEDESCLETEVEERTTCVSDSTPPPPPPRPPPPPQDPVRVQSMLRGFLLLTKQLQVFKESWARRRLGAQIFSTPSSYRQFMNLYRAEIFYPSMRALALRMGKARDYELLISGSQSFLPPPGASETDVKAWQLSRLLESTECDMIKAAQRKVHGDLTLVVSERTRQNTSLPTELWKKTPLRFSLSPERPQIVESFVEQLMGGAEQVEGQLRISPDHLRRCCTHLGSSLMERERRGFLLYSHFYEQILQQQTQLLYQREQDLKNLNESQTNNPHKEVSGLCRGMTLEISALQARVAHLEEERRSSEELLGLRFKERYDPLVRHLFSTCIQLKTRLDEHRGQTLQDVSVMVNRTRREGVDRITKLKEKHCCTTGDDGLALTQLKKEDVHELSLENRRLTALLGKLKALRRWRQVVDEETLHRRLLQTQQREITSRTEALGVKMAAEEEVVSLQEELDVVRQMLSRCQAECSRTKKLLSARTEELQVARQRSAQEARTRQELETHRAQSLEQMRADVDDRERQLRELSERLDRGGRMDQLQRQRSAKEIRQVKGQLHQERCLKREAFQQVETLKNQVNDTEAALSRVPSAAGRRTCFTPSVRRWSTRSPSAAARAVQESEPRLRLSSPSQVCSGSVGSTNSAALQDLGTERRHRGAETTERSRSNTRTAGDGADRSRPRVLTAETLLPEL